MEKIGVKVKHLHPDAKTPFYATEESAGFDLYSVEDLTIPPKEQGFIHTGISLEIPKGFHIQLWDRSGKAKQGLTLSGGVMDSDYRGEYRIMAYNSASTPHKIEKGDRIAQALLLPIFKADFQEVDELSETERGDKGFQSSGLK